MSSRVLGNSLVSAAAKREFALNPFSPINKPCLHRTLHIGNKMVFLSSLLDASSSTLSSHCVQSCFFNPFASTYLSKDLQNSSIFFRDDFCPPTCAHPVLYPTAPCPSPPPFSNSCVRCKKKSVTPTPKKDTTTTYQANRLRNSLYTKRDVDAFCEMCIWARVIRACLFFFPPIQNDSMSVLLIWRVQCRKKKKHTHTKQLANLFILFQGDN